MGQEDNSYLYWNLELRNYFLINMKTSSLLLSKKLKELGVKQESEFYWVENPDGTYVLYQRPDKWIKEGGTLENYWDKFYSAFTADELGEILDGRAYAIKTGWNPDIYECIPCKDIHIDRYVFGDTMADAMAKMIFYLLENKLIKL